MIPLIDDIARWLGGGGETIPPGSYLSTRAVRILMALPFPVAVCDGHLAVVAASPSFERLVRIRREPKVRPAGKNLFQLFRNIPNLASQFRDRSDRDPLVLSGDFPRLGRRVFHLFIRAIPCPERTLLLIFQDVTNQTELTRMIEKSRSELLSVFDGIDDPMVMIDRKFRIRRINEAMLKILEGRSYKDFIGKACYWKLHGRKEVCPGCTAFRSFEQGKRTSRTGLLEATPSAGDFSYEITCHPLKDTAGKTTAVAECYRDTTEVRRIEEELYESERARIMEPLAAGIAHEVRNPLAVIRSTAQYWMGEVGENEEIKEGFQSIIQSTEAANHVISDLIDFARPPTVNFERQPLKPILETGLSLIKSRAEMQKVDVTKSIRKNLPPLILDGKRFLQAYMNFLINALDAMPCGGKLTVTAGSNNGHREVEVRIGDTGEGVPEEMISKVFQPFYSTKKEGVGLGLPVAEGIIRSHGGRVCFKSTKGRGTEVKIVLPRNHPDR